MNQNIINIYPSNIDGSSLALLTDIKIFTQTATGI